MTPLYNKYSRSELDENGVVSRFTLNCPDHFNFAYDVVDEIARQEPHKRALVWCDIEGNHREFCFSALSELSSRAANFLKKQGVKKGDRVMVILKRHYEYWYTLLALHKLGAIPIPATYMLTAADIIYRVNTAEVRAVICAGDEEITRHVREARAQCPTLSGLFNVRTDREDFLRLDTGLEAESVEFPRVETQVEEPFLMYFTSGTTGYPKVVVHNYSYPLAHIVTAKYWQQAEDGGLHLTVADTGWAKASWGKIYGQWLCGSAVMAYDFEHFVAEELMAVVARFGVTTFCAPPTIYRFLVKSGLSQYDFSGLHHVTTAGEALNPAIIQEFRDKTGLQIMEGYGQTETTLLIGNLAGTTPKEGSLGKASPLYRLDIMRPDGSYAGAGEQGEIVVIPTDEHHYGLCTCYDKDEDSDIRAWRHGVYHTGDIAWRDEDGFYWYVSRIDDVIKSSGYRIGPFEVESVVIRHPAVLECAVTGVPDEQRGFLIKATIVLNQGYTASDELAREIQHFVKENTAPYKYPRLVEFVAELPKTISGKIRHAEIRKNSEQAVPGK